MPNALAYLALVSWPLVTLALWQRLDPARALIWTILGGYLILPPLQATIGLPGLPDLNKVSLPNVMALACAVWLLHDRVSFLPATLAGRVLMVIYLFSPFATVLTNTDPVIDQNLYLQGTSLYDSFAAVAQQVINLMPFFLARRYLGSADQIRLLAVALVAGGLAYVLPILIEARLSPQINIWVYGFFAHDFLQTIRFGGYRPMVFLPHGLWLAFFICTTYLAALHLTRETRPDDRVKWAGFTIVLAVTLVLCRSVGPLAYAVALTPLILVAGPRWQIRVAGLMALIVVTYPLLRGLHVVPLETIRDLAEAISPDRAASFYFRVVNEDILLAHAEERPLFGWGGYGRNLVHDPLTGVTTTVSDGMWIIRLGISGWMGYLGEFGLLALPLLLLAREAWRLPAARIGAATGCIALIYAANLVDLLPNATLEPLTWLIGGALLGRAEQLRQARRATAPRAETRVGIQPIL